MHVPKILIIRGPTRSSLDLPISVLDFYGVKGRAEAKMSGFCIAKPIHPSSTNDPFGPREDVVLLKAVRCRVWSVFRIKKLGNRIGGLEIS